jgi:uncharacterized protein YjbJ (UPF0337 family)
MNSDTLKGQWKQLKGAAKEKWGQLTDDELDMTDGQKDQLIGRIQERYGYTRDVAEREVDDFFNTRVPK